MSEQLPPAIAESLGTLPEAANEAIMAKSPNEELAARVVAALAAANLLPAVYQDQCQMLLAEGKVTGMDWTKFLEKPIGPSHD